ncbi:PH domain-containing protein [Trichonephila clavipes]|nr:PH domain-containing protein [Trichonephila clavipes]
MQDIRLGSVFEIPSSDSFINPLRKGHLQKLTGRGWLYSGSWKKRYCVLEGSKFYFYENEVNHHSSQTKSGIRSRVVVVMVMKSWPALFLMGIATIRDSLTVEGMMHVKPVEVQIFQVGEEWKSGELNACSGFLLVA